MGLGRAAVYFSSFNYARDSFRVPSLKVSVAESTPKPAPPKPFDPQQEDLTQIFVNITTLGRGTAGHATFVRLSAERPTFAEGPKRAMSTPVLTQALLWEYGTILTGPG